MNTTAYNVRQYFRETQAIESLFWNEEIEQDEMEERLAELALRYPEAQSVSLEEYEDALDDVMLILEVF